MTFSSQSTFVNSLLLLHKATNTGAFDQLTKAPFILTREPDSKSGFLRIGDLRPKKEMQQSRSQHSLDIPKTQQGCSVVSYPDSALCSSFFSPKLEHSDQVLVHSFESTKEVCLPHEGAPAADGFILHLKKITPSALKAVVLGMRTADCLTWVSIFETPEETLVSFAHLGWRSFTKGLHFKILERIATLVPYNSWKNSARHYLAPSIFGRSYPCQSADVGKELENLQALRNSFTLDPAGLHELGGSLDAWKRAASALAPTDSQSGLCYPDLQLLCLLDLAATGVSLDKVLLHRVNTAESMIYPSYRHGRKKENSDSRRLVTTVRWNEHFDCLATNAYDVLPVKVPESP